MTPEAKESGGPKPDLQAILKEAMEGTGATGAAIAFTTEDALCCRASAGSPAPEVGARLQEGTSLTGLCFSTGEIQMCNDTKSDRRVDPQLCKEKGIQSVLVLPIKRNAEVMGVLEVLSINPNAFNRHDAIAMSRLAGRVLPSTSEFATIPDRCLNYLPSEHIEAMRDVKKTVGDADKPGENRDPIPAATAAEMLQWNEHYIGAQLSDKPMTIASREHWSGRGWLTRGLAAIALAAAISLGYGYHLNHTKVATQTATLSIEAANHTTAFPNQLNTSSEQNKKTNGRWKASDGILRATTQEVILAIQETEPGTHINRTLNLTDADDSIAQYEMALRYADGEGMPQNYPVAMQWFAKAAANGNADGQWKLGLGYFKGIGVPHDEREAVLWFKRAANHGNIRAQSALSDLYLTGRGVPRDYVRAYTWAAIGGGLRGNDSDRLSGIRALMTRVQIEEANRKISSWRNRQTLKAFPSVSSR